MTSNDSALTPAVDLATDIQSELEETQRALREVTLMIEQSHSEVNKLTQRNAAITGHLPVSLPPRFPIGSGLQRAGRGWE